MPQRAYNKPLESAFTQHRRHIYGVGRPGNHPIFFKVQFSQSAEGQPRLG